LAPSSTTTSTNPLHILTPFHSRISTALVRACARYNLVTEQVAA
jgi:hypothetical protein